MYEVEWEKREGGEQEEESSIRVSDSCCHIDCKWIIFEFLTDILGPLDSATHSYYFGQITESLLLE